MTRLPDTRTAAGIPNPFIAFTCPSARAFSPGVESTVQRLGGVFRLGSADVADSLNIPLHCIEPSATRRWIIPPPALQPPR
ncbi:hypothetical protein ATCV1_z331R [Acanthocystis turfacea chlorella virus 1]|uniref:Uncharacterized protein z331R n=1 Tax=Chlorovirus heliozoae TaxID=322019 RepID=A7K8U1_9PHYC|nr:hypothetical protein ATCV1_z331R [Acanthocystis turfacea chlorella virus 1]ABT16465.1 hypothetical protein ATCV1_z331R [Acanthocystis turfacea chlorella virus 1]